jgi:uncharacterized membrane protein (UPF0127 family)
MSESGARPAARNETRGTLLAARLEVASSLWARFRGLMGRRDLAAGEGLWLTSGNGIHMMFMRFPIDAVFLGKPRGDGARPVVGVRRALRPWIGIVPLVRGADGVLELAVGTIDATATQPGDAVRIE